MNNTKKIIILVSLLIIIAFIAFFVFNSWEKEIEEIEETVIENTETRKLETVVHDNSNAQLIVDSFSYNKVKQTFFIEWWYKKSHPIEIRINWNYLKSMITDDDWKFKFEVNWIWEFSIIDRVNKDELLTIDWESINTN